MRVIVQESTGRSSEASLCDPLIVFKDMAHLKRTKKQMLRQLALLNESHDGQLTADRVVGKKKRSATDADEPIVVVKKLAVGSAKTPKKTKDGVAVKRKAPTDESGDSIELVADVKTTSAKKARVETDSVAKNGNGAAAASEDFPWEVTDLEQFERVLSKNLNGLDLSKDSDTKKAKVIYKNFIFHS